MRPGPRGLEARPKEKRRGPTSSRHGRSQEPQVQNRASPRDRCRSRTKRGGSRPVLRRLSHHRHRTEMPCPAWKSCLHWTCISSGSTAWHLDPRVRTQPGATGPPDLPGHARLRRDTSAAAMRWRIRRRAARVAPAGAQDSLRSGRPTVQRGGATRGPSPGAPSPCSSRACWTVRRCVPGWQPRYRRCQRLGKDAPMPRLMEALHPALANRISRPAARSANDGGRKRSRSRYRPPARPRSVPRSAWSG